MIPPMNIRVRVFWEGRLFEAARVRHPTTKAVCWLTERDRRPAFVPDNLFRPEHDNPEFWAPIAPDKWQAPLPRIAMEIPDDVRMWNSKTAFNAAEAAAEMEREREEAGNVSRETERLSGRVAQQWWRDHSLIVYEPMAEISYRMAEGRVMRAVACCEAGGGLTLASKTVSGLVAAMAEAVDLSTRDAVEDYAPRLEQLPKDRSDFVTAMGWFTAIDPPAGGWLFSRAQLCLWLRARPMPWSFTEIGEHGLFKVSGERARQIYANAIRKVQTVARQGVTPAPDQMASLRERNRRKKREAMA